MPVQFQLPVAQPEADALAHGRSPLAEAAFSLCVLVKPRQYSVHARWVRHCRRELPLELRREIRELAPLFAGSIPGFLTATTPRSAGWGTELGRVTSMPSARACREVMVATRGHHDARTAAVRRLWRDAPDAALQRLGAFLDRYWHAVFQAEWRRTLPLLDAEIERRRTAAAGTALGEGILTLGDGTIVAGPDCLKLARRLRPGQQITLAPSAFLWPHVCVEPGPAWPTAVFYPLPERVGTSGLDADTALLATLRAIGDPTRLAILRLVIDRPRSTQELAELLSMSESAVSQHLRQLRSAGVVTSRRDGHYVLYVAWAERLRQSATALIRLVAAAERAAAESACR
jgi:DNA-binding transcriptional ArsR family regulator